jgi:hypothetical protein
MAKNIFGGVAGLVVAGLRQRRNAMTFTLPMMIRAPFNWCSRHHRGGNRYGCYSAIGHR